MNYPQYRRMRKLVHECCNYDGGNCILLDDGEECVCVQSISYSLHDMGSPQSHKTLWGEEEQRNEQVLPLAVKRAIWSL